MRLRLTARDGLQPREGQVGSSTPLLWKLRLQFAGAVARACELRRGDPPALLPVHRPREVQLLHPAPKRVRV
jgi:hypothetical protein